MVDIKCAYEHQKKTCTN